MKRIEVFGRSCLLDCPTCATRIPVTLVNQALAELGIEARVVVKNDIGEAQEHGVTRLPALVVDGKVISQGRTLSYAEIVDLLREKEEEK